MEEKLKDTFRKCIAWYHITNDKIASMDIMDIISRKDCQNMILPWVDYTSNK